MRASHKLTNLLLSLTALLAFASVAMAADPGLPYPATSAISDQKAGSVLIYNIYSSTISNPGANNTRINITNTDDGTVSREGVFVHFFFVDGGNCSVADSYVCLTPNQTMSFNMSDIDPGVTGYVVAVATGRNGCPIAFNYLIGDEYVKFQGPTAAGGPAANLGAEAIAAIDVTGGPNNTPDGIPDGLVCDPATAASAILRFNNTMYNALPRVLALDHIMSRGDSNDTTLIVNRIGGSLVTSGASIGNLFGLLYDPLENPVSWTAGPFGCQLNQVLGPNRFPRTTPRFETFIPAGSYGWMKFWGTDGSDRALLGAAINFNVNAGSNQNAFNGGHNLHKLTFTTEATLTVPVFTAFCS
ncbi:MAG: hypothetical protein U0Z53_13350 [Blastocatellia bacterium]